MSRQEKEKKPSSLTNTDTSRKNDQGFISNFLGGLFGKTGYESLGNNQDNGTHGYTVRKMDSGYGTMTPSSSGTNTPPNNGK